MSILGRTPTEAAKGGLEYLVAKAKPKSVGCEKATVAPPLSRRKPQRWAKKAAVGEVGWLKLEEEEEEKEQEKEKEKGLRVTPKRVSRKKGTSWVRKVPLRKVGKPNLVNQLRGELEENFITIYNSVYNIGEGIGAQTT